MRFRFALFRHLVELFVVGERVRIRPGHMRVNQRRAAAFAAHNSLLPGKRCSSSIGSVPSHFRNLQSRETLATNFEMLPPAVCTSTGTEIA